MSRSNESEQRPSAVRDPGRGARAPAGREVRLSALEVLRRFDQRATARLRAVPARGIGHTALSLLSHSADSVVLVPGGAAVVGGPVLPREHRGAAHGRFPAVRGAHHGGEAHGAPRRPRASGAPSTVEWIPIPSPPGHASRTVTLAVVVLAGNLVLAGVLLAAWSLAVGFTRVALGVHFLLDVLRGYVLGLATGLAVSLWVAGACPAAVPGGPLERPLLSRYDEPPGAALRQSGRRSL